MKPTNPPYPYCWVHTKWGRHKARVTAEYIQVGGIHDGQVYVKVEMDRISYNYHIKHKIFALEHIEYIEE